MPPLLVQKQPRSQMVSDLTRSLMRRPPMPVHGPMGAIANVAGPMIGAGLEAYGAHQEKKEEQAETTALGRLLSEAAEAQRSGEDPMERVNAILEESGGEPGYAGAGRGFMDLYQAQLAQSLFPGEAKPETFGQPVKGVTEAGDPAYMRFGSRGGQQAVEGFTPPAGAATGQTQLAKLIAERNAMAPNDPSRRLYDTAIQRASAGSGMDVEVGPDGMVRVSTGVSRGPGGTPLTKSAQNKAQKEILDTTDMLAGLYEIEDRLDPEFLTFAGQAEQWLTSLKSRAGADLTPEQRQKAAEYHSFKAATLETASNKIQQLSGAAVSEAEYKRLSGFLPTMEDDPVGFESKMKRLISQSKLAVARYSYFMNRGIPRTDAEFKKLPLRDMGRVIQKRGDELYDDIRATNPDASAEEIKAMTRARMQEEFGI